METISRFSTRIARHGQKPEDGPELQWNPRREAYLQHIVSRPSFQALNTEEDDFRQLAGDLGESQKKRIYARYEENTAQYLAGVYNGHTVHVELSPQLQPIKNPQVFVRETTWGAACRILREGLRVMGRKHIHMAPLHMNPRQEAYLKPSPKKSHVLTIDGIMASAFGILFYELDNGVIISRGIDGLIPPCCVSGLFPNTNMGRRSLDLEASKADAPKVVPTSVMPDHGPPILVKGRVFMGIILCHRMPKRFWPLEEHHHEMSKQERICRNCHRLVNRQCQIPLRVDGVTLVHRLRHSLACQR